MPRPIRADGKLLVIDGGFAKSYRAQTGRAGYITRIEAFVDLMRRRKRKQKMAAGASGDEKPAEIVQ